MQTNDTTTQPAKKRRRWVTPVLTLTALILGVSIGAAGGDSDATAEATAPISPAPTVTETAETEPAPTVTETAEPEPAATVTETAEPVTEEVEVASASCLNAIDSGEEVIDLLTQGMDYAADGFHAASLMDVAGINAAADEMEALHGPLGDAGFDWGFWAEACKDDGQ